jgi:phage/plasmid-like protein (TIGR03299 family)
LAARIGDDVQKGYLLFCTSHDGSYSYLHRLSLTRVVCQNTLNQALSEKGKASFRVRHTKNAMDRIASAHQALEGLAGDIKSVEGKLQFLAGRKVTRESLTTIFDRLFPKRETEDGKPVESTRRDNTLAEVLSLYENNDNDAFPDQRGTAYNLLNSVIAYTDHYRVSQNNGRPASALFGSGDRLKGQALLEIMKEADKMPPARQPGFAVDFAELGLKVPALASV